MSDIEKGTEKEKGLHKCDLCGLSYSSEKDLREHFWSLMHHVNIEQKKKNSLHNCTLCFTACTTIAEYRRHLRGGKHKKALEDSQKAAEEKGAAESQESHRQRSNRSQSPRSSRIVEDNNPNSSEDDDLDTEQDFDGGYSRDPVFYKKKKNKSMPDTQPWTNSPHSRWDGPESYSVGPYNHYHGNWWDQGYSYDDDYPAKTREYNYYHDDFPRGYGRPDFPPFHNRYRWHRPQRGFGGYRRPPSGVMQNQLYTDFCRSGPLGNDSLAGKSDMNLERSEDDVNENWGKNEGSTGNQWNEYPSEVNGYQPDGNGQLQSGNTGPWPSWRHKTQRKNNFENREKFFGKNGRKGSLKTIKNKNKGKVGGDKKVSMPSVNGDSPDNANGRKRCRDFDADSTASKSSRLTHGGNGSLRVTVKSGSLNHCGTVVNSDCEADTLSSSIKSTSSNLSKSSDKSRSSSASPSIRLKTLSARKLQNTRFSPKVFHVSPKIKQINKKVTHEQEDNEDDTETGILEKAEKLCKELRERRQKAKLDQEKILKTKKKEHREVLNKAIRSLNDTNKSRIKGHLLSLERGSHALSSEVSERENGIDVHTSSQNSTEFTVSGNRQASSTGTPVSNRERQSSSPTPEFRNDIDRIRHTIESSVRRSQPSPAKTTTTFESPGNTVTKSKRPLSKDSLLKMVNSPRSRNERMQLARMLRSHTKSLNKLAPSRLNVQLNGLYDNYDFDEEGIPAISLEDLSPEVKLQIAQLIEDEVNTDRLENDMLRRFPMTDSRESVSKPSVKYGMETMEVVADYVSMTDKQETPVGDDVLQIGDLKSPQHRISTDSAVIIDSEMSNTESVKTGHTAEPVVTVTSINGVPQLQISEPIVSSNSHTNAVTSPVVMDSCDVSGGGHENQGITSSPTVSVAVDLGRRALQMSGLERFSPVHNSLSPSASYMPTSPLSPSQGGPLSVHKLVDLALAEEEKHKEIEELDQKIDVMRQMLRRTLEHLEKSEHRRRELVDSTKHIRDQRFQILKGITGHPSIKSPQHTAQPSIAPSDNATPTHIRESCESMDLEPVTDTVSSTSYVRSDISSRTEVSQPDSHSLSAFIAREDDSPDLTTRPVSISTVSAPCSFDKETATNPALSQHLSMDDRPSSSIALSCVAVKQEQVTPPLEACSPITSCTRLAQTGEGSSAVNDSITSQSSFANGLSGPVVSNSLPVSGCFSSSSVPVAPESGPTNNSFSIEQIATNDAVDSESSVVLLSSPNTPTKSSNPLTSVPTETIGEDRLSSLSIWSPSTDRLMSVSGSSLKRTKFVDDTITSVKELSKCSNPVSSSVSVPLKDKVVNSIVSGPLIHETNERVILENSAKGSTSSGFCSISSVPRRMSGSDQSPVTNSSAVRSVRSRTISDSSDGDLSKKSSNVPMAYLGSFSGGVGTAAVLKKLAADLGSLGNLNSMSCVMLDKQDISDKLTSISTRTRNNSESSIKSVGHAPSDIQLMELDLKGDSYGKDSTPREESDQSGTSLGEKIRRYCQTSNRRMSLDTIAGGCSDGDRTLGDEAVTRAESPGSDNTPGRTLKHCSVVLQKLELEKNSDEQEGEETQEMACHQDVVKEVPKQTNHEANSKDSAVANMSMKGPLSPGRKKRKTKKERDILANRRSYWFDSSSDNTSQEDDNVPKLSNLKQQLIFNHKEDNSSEVDHESADKGNCSITEVKKEVEVLEDQVLAEVSQNDMEAIKNVQIDPLLLNLHAEVNTSQKSWEPPVSDATPASTVSSHLTYAGPSDPVTGLQVFNNYLYVCYQGKDIRRYHVQSGELDQVYNCSYHSVQCMAVVAAQGKEDCIYAGGMSFYLIVFNVKSPQIAQTFELTGEIKCMHYDSGFVYIGLVSGSVEVFDVKNNRHKDSFQCAYQAIHCIASAREGGSKLICVSAQDTTISVCDARSGLPVRILGGHTKTSFSVMSSDHFVFSGSGDRTVMMHNLHTGKLEWTFKDHNGIVTSVWVEGNYLYSAAFDRLVRCFDIKNRTLKRMFYGAGKGVIMSMTVNGDKLYTGSRDGLVECVALKSESWPCQMENCHYLFGLKEHLLHHMLTDHSNTINKITQCKWKGCSDWLTLHRDDTSLKTHMQKHVDSLEEQV